MCAPSCTGRLEQENKSAPDKRKKVDRIDQGQDQHHKSDQHASLSCPFFEDKPGSYVRGELQSIKKAVYQKHAGQDRCKIKIGLDMRPQPFGGDTCKVPVLKTKIPNFKEKPKNGRPEKKCNEFAGSSENEPLVPAPPEETVKKDYKAVPAKRVGVGIERKNIMSRAPKGQNDHCQARNHHQFADDTRDHSIIYSRNGSPCFFL